MVIFGLPCENTTVKIVKGGGDGLGMERDSEVGLEHDCSLKAEHCEAAAVRHTEGLKALADAKKVIAATSGEAEALASLVQGPSFLQVSSGSSPTFKGGQLRARSY
jgi:hypothetical protein